MTPRLLGHLRSAATLAVLLLLLLYGVARGLDEVSEPFPEVVDAPICEDSPVTSGDILRPGGITVSVLNASGRQGLADITLGDLEDQGFARGEISNVEGEDVASAQIWSPQGRSAAVRLVRGYLGGNVQVLERSGPSAGITIVVGDRFPGVREGRPELRVRADGSVCSPPGLS